MDFYYYFMKSSINPLEGAVNCVIKIDGDKSTPISTLIKTPKKNWNAKEQCFEGKDSAKKENLKKLFEKRMESIRDELAGGLPNQPIDPNDILKIHRLNKKEIIDGRKPTEKIKVSFLEHFRMYIKWKEKLVEKKRLKNVTINVLIAKQNRIEEFLKSKNLLDLKTDNFTPQLLFTLKENFILDDYADSTIAKYEQIVKTVQIWACKKGLAKHRPLDNYKVEPPKDKAPISLEAEELQLIEDLRLSGSLNEDLCNTADIYRFCMETSLSISDYNKLTDDMLLTSKSGNFKIHSARNKSVINNDIIQRIPLSEKALEIMKRYGSFDKMPRKSNYHLNTGIRRIAKLCKIDKYLTFHTSRKSAANDMLNNKKMNAIAILGVMGLTSDRMLKKYAKISDETIEAEFFKTKE